MAIPSEPQVIIDSLPKADGSASYSYAGYTVTGSVNGPIEAQRRDEQPFEAIIDVIVRPAAGVGGTRERHLESVLTSALSQLILLKNFPRQLFQIVLQITSIPENDYAYTKLMQAGSNLPVIPALLQTAMLGLLSAAVPMRTTATAITMAIAKENTDGNYLMNPTPRQVELAESVHVFGFTRQGELLMAESEGNFTPTQWGRLYDAAKGVCCEKPKKQGMEMVLDDEEAHGVNLADFIRLEAESKADSDLHWKSVGIA